MQISFELFTVNKRFPLTISRGTTAASTNIWLRLEAEGISGWGEASSFSLSPSHKYTTPELISQLQTISTQLEKFHPLERQKIHQFLSTIAITSPVKAAIDVALQDWLGKSLAMPLWRLWGLDVETIPQLSLTIGISTPELAQARLKNWQTILDIPIIKVKMGNPDGIAADKAMFLAIRALAPSTPITVDANGGWQLTEAIAMSQWLANQGVEYLEQPLSTKDESDLAKLHQESPLPIFVDESCCNSTDLLRLAPYIDGVNLKLMKTGGLTEIMNMIQIAKTLDKQIMYGCYSDSSLANTAMSHLAPLVDYLDLDSHLNLTDDPFVGATVKAGKLIPPDLPGLGVKHRGNQN
ncbi:MAG: dipeptide epimerase [Gloeocapsa sp. DLM2.Bin57]|nr:MAG: dipeptide epimerase [Gloeocapsa sp. DLM2.Bin57]